MQRDIEQIESSGIVLEAPTDHSNEGLPIGNGRMGTLVWTTPSSLNFQINRVDVFAVNRNAAGEHFSAAGATTDYCGTCAQLRIDCGNEPFRPGPDFRQALSLHSARCTVDGRGVDAECWVAAEDDVLIVTGGEHAGDFLKLLKTGKHLNLKHLEYAYQEGHGGIAEGGATSVPEGSIGQLRTH